MASLRTRAISLLSKDFTRVLNQLTPHRLGSYYNSPFIEDVNEVNRKYTVTKDPEEWKYVEMALPPLTVPNPKPKEHYASGWKPQANDLRDKPFFIERTKNHMLPIYLIIAQRGMKRTTVIRKIKGDIWLLHEELIKFLDKNKTTLPPIRSQVNEFAGFIRVHGDFVNAAKYWLEKQGY